MQLTDRIVQLIISVFLIVGVYQFYFWCQRNSHANGAFFKFGFSEACLRWTRPLWCQP